MKHEDIGFTLIEILIAIAIIGILAIIVLPSLISAQKRSYDTGARMCAKSMQTSQAIFYLDNKKYTPMSGQQPDVEEILRELNRHCKNINIFYKDRSLTNTFNTDYIFDIWDARGTSVITATPLNISSNVVGATPFSNNGSGGQNFP
ncbi:prepilin-type N-terminal cleavage/methylation domain-containing protein [Deinococcus sp. LM3]|uniref:prepilin-type N-terminal cleavage/methylation domain-containing protein n=1 Tax=Deinococcus sp. LM3 TaxID=1938608 RepID=UPI00099233C0|nr:prepilin-type N-terminal cleavage/methylation domain-containing protein [Deinococcus sp. LM3]OOV14073.1 hypothetical protein BXU09_04645 [Deinococcus sp. LM3]